MKKNIENSDMPISSPTMLAPLRVRRRKIENGISGWRERRSITRNAISRSAAPASRRSVAVDPQPELTVSTTAYTSNDRPAVTVTAPGRSNVVVPSSARLSTSVRGASSAATIPIGTLTNSTQRQLRPLVRIPPSSTPAAPPAPATAPQMPSARLRSAPSANVTVMIDSAAGETIAAPRPCTARAAINHPSDWAIPPANEASENTTKPSMNMRRRPRRSAIRPPSRRNPPKVST